MAYTEAERIALARQTLDAAMDNLLALELAGPQAWVDYTEDGGSYQFSNAKRTLQERIKGLQELIQTLQGAFIVKSRGV